MATTYNIPEAVTVDIRVDGETIAKTFGPGDVALDPAIAEILVAQGFATETKSKASKTSTPDPVTSEE